MLDRRELPPPPLGGREGRSPRGDLGAKQAVKLAQLGGVWGGSPKGILATLYGFGFKGCVIFLPKLADRIHFQRVATQSSLRPRWSMKVIPETLRIHSSDLDGPCGGRAYVPLVASPEASARKACSSRCG